MGRPEVDSEAVNVRLQRPYLDALDAYAAAELDHPTRPQAIREILADWLRVHGFLKTEKHVEPKGPASEVVKQMDAAIEEHRSRRKKRRAESIAPLDQGGVPR